MVNYFSALFASVNGVGASDHVTMSTSIIKALHFHFLENGCVMLYGCGHGHMTTRTNPILCCHTIHCTLVAN